MSRMPVLLACVERGGRMVCNADRQTYRQTQMDRQTDRHRRTDRQTDRLKHIHLHAYTPRTCMSCAVHAWLLIQTAKVDFPLSPSDSALLSAVGTKLHIIHTFPPCLFPSSFPYTHLPPPFFHLLIHLPIPTPPSPTYTHTHLHMILVFV